MCENFFGGFFIMYCKNCGEQLNDNQAICLKCGVAVGNGNAYCPNCGQPTAPEAEFCTSCGVSLKKGKVNGKGIPENEKVKYALIAFFLGGLGIHNFMLGETKKGVTRLVASLCFGLGWILALIDFIKILTDSYEINPDTMFF